MRRPFLLPLAGLLLIFLAACSAEKTRDKNIREAVTASYEENNSIHVDHIELLQVDSMTRLYYLIKLGAYLETEIEKDQIVGRETVAELARMSSYIDLDHLQLYSEEVKKDVNEKKTLLEFLNERIGRYKEQLASVKRKVTDENQRVFYCFAIKANILYQQDGAKKAETKDLYLSKDFKLLDFKEEIAEL